MATILSTPVADHYVGLVSKFPLRPIRNKSQHQQALAMLRGLNGKRTAAVRDYKIVLAGLIAEFERTAGMQLDTSDVSASDVVLHLLEQREMSVNLLAKTLAISQSSLSQMLSGRRGWSKQVIICLCDYFGLQAGLFLR